MPRFFLHQRHGTDFTEDEEGYDVPDLDAMRSEAVWAAREQIAELVMRGWPCPPDSLFEVTDEAGRIIHTLRFADALDGSTPPKPAPFWVR